MGPLISGVLSLFRSKSVVVKTVEFLRGAVASGSPLPPGKGARQQQEPGRESTAAASKKSANHDEQAGPVGSERKRRRLDGREGSPPPNNGATQSALVIHLMNNINTQMSMMVREAGNVYIVPFI